MRSRDASARIETMEFDADDFVLCEHGHDPGDCRHCDAIEADVFEPVERLRVYLAAHPELVDAPEPLQGVPLN
jgi:hypothetical protein